MKSDLNLKDNLTGIQRKLFDNAVRMVIGENIEKGYETIGSLAQKTLNDEVLFWNFLIKSVLTPEEAEKDFNAEAMNELYWQHYWIFLAYLKDGKEVDAGDSIENTRTAFPNRPAGDVVLSEAAFFLYLYFETKDSGYYEHARECLANHDENISDLLRDFKKTMMNLLFNGSSDQQAGDARSSFWLKKVLNGCSSIVLHSKEEDSEQKNAISQIVSSLTHHKNRGFENIDVKTATTEQIVAEFNRLYDNKQYSEAAKIILPVADHLYADTHYKLGYMYKYGKGFTKDLTKAFEWNIKAAEKGLLKAQFSLALMYYYLLKDYDKAYIWYRSAALLGGGVSSRYILSKIVEKFCWLYGYKQYSEAVNLILPVAERIVDADAQCILGWLYATGSGVAKNDAEAYKLYRKSAEQGYAEAQYYLALMYHNGEGVAKNTDEAIKWLKKAAAQGDVNAVDTLHKLTTPDIDQIEDEFFRLFDNGQYTEAVKVILPFAEQANTDTLRCLGWIYATGNGIAKNHTEAYKCFSKAAEQGDKFSQFELGKLYDKGNGVAKNFAEACKWYSKAAEQGSAKAQYSLGVNYQFGLGVAKDTAKADGLFRKAVTGLVDDNDAEAVFYLGNMSLNGWGVSKDKTEAIISFQRAAENGNLDAHHEMGRYYNNDLKDYAKAYSWYMKAAKEGHKPSQTALGRMYYWGELWGTASKGLVNRTDAINWLTEAAARGENEASDMLRELTGPSQKQIIADFQRLFENKQYSEALKVILPVADRADIFIQFRIGWLYHTGKGIATDYTKAAFWYKKAAERGNQHAQCNLGILFQTGKGVTQDYAKALHWYQKSAEQGNAGGQANLGIMFKNGYGVAKNTNEAIKWYKKAADKGSNLAKEELNKLGVRYP